MKTGAAVKFQMVLIIVCLFMLAAQPAAAANKWDGVDVSVVEKYAAENGRAARTPYINTDQGDLLLFVFLLAGAVGGFAAGYYWKTLISEKPEQREELADARPKIGVK